MQKTLALMTRALRVDARGVSPHLLRCGLALIAFFILIAISLETGGAATGLMFFQFLWGLNVIFVSFAGVSGFASCITEEKEEQTLPLLRLANVSGLSIVTGKYVPQLLGAALLLAAELPFTMLAVSLGGILPSRILTAYVALFGHLVWMSSLGLLCSIVSQRSQTAILLAILGTLLHLFGADVAGFFVSGFQSYHWISQATADSGEAILSSIRSTSLMRNMWMLPLSMLSTQVVTNLIGGLILCGLSVVLFPAFAEESPLAHWKLPRLTGQRRRRAKRSRRAWTSPILWRDFMFLTGGHRGIALQVGGGFLLLMILIWEAKDFSKDDAYVTQGWISLFVVLIVFGMHLGRMFGSELREQTWSGLVLLPQSVLRTCLEKLGAVFVATLPFAIWWYVCIKLVPKGSANFFQLPLNQNPWLHGFQLAYLISQFLLAYHMLVLTSVLWPRCSWPVALILGAMIVYLGNILVIVVIIQRLRLSWSPTMEIVNYTLGLSGTLALMLFTWITTLLLLRRAARV